MAKASMITIPKPKATKAPSTKLPKAPQLKGGLKGYIQASKIA